MTLSATDVTEHEPACADDDFVLPDVVDPLDEQPPATPPTTSAAASAAHNRHRRMATPRGPAPDLSRRGRPLRARPRLLPLPPYPALAPANPGQKLGPAATEASVAALANCL